MPTRKAKPRPWGTANGPSTSAAQWVPMGDLVAWGDNPRINDHAVADVAASIKRFGFASPIIAREESGEIIAGHTRYKAALSLGLDRVPVRYLALDPTEAHLLALADNRTAEIADWSDGLSDVLRALEEDGADLSGIGWNDDELSELLAPIDELDGTEDDVPDIQDEVDSEPGRVYELGPHRLICGDCRDPEVVARLLDGCRVNVAFTSPPYASQRKYDESSSFKPIRPSDFVDWFELVQAQIAQHLAEDGSWFVNIKEHCDDGQRVLYVKDLALAHVRRWGWRLVDELCWQRVGLPGSYPNRFKNGWEPVFHFSKTKDIKFRPDHVAHAYDATGAITCDEVAALGRSGGYTSAGSLGGPGSVKSKHRTTALPSNVLSASGVGAGVRHPAMYPVALPGFFIRAFSDASDVIFDPFLGSGSTLIAAAKEGRVAYGMELSPGYCDVIRRRWTRWAHDHNRDPGPGALDAAITD